MSAYDPDSRGADVPGDARTARDAGVAGAPIRRVRTTDDILREGPGNTAERLPDGWRDRADAAQLAEHGRALDAHELEYRVALRKAHEAGESANVIGAAKAKLTEVEGERAATRFMLEHYPDAELYQGFTIGTGFDQVWVRRVNGKIRQYIIVEAKGPGAELLKDATKGAQMSNEWVTNTAMAMKERGRPLGGEILHALENDKDIIVSGHLIEADGFGGAIEREIPGGHTHYTLHDEGE